LKNKRSDILVENNANIQEIQPLVEQLYPNLSDIPVNSISSSISGTGEDVHVNFLIIADDKILKPFLAEGDDAKYKTVTSIEKGRGKIDYDLFMEFSFFFNVINKAKVVFQVKFDSDNKEIQKMYVDALKTVDVLKFFVLDEHKRVQRVFEMEWYYYKNKKILSKLEKVNFK
jgi:hypothetical protein